MLEAMAAQERTQVAKGGNVAVAESNPFQVLMVSEDEAQALAFLSREWPSGPRAQGAEASERQPREALAKGRLLAPEAEVESSSIITAVHSP